MRTSTGALDAIAATGAALDHSDPAVRAGFNLYEIGPDGAVGRIESYALDAAGTDFSPAPIPVGRD